MPFTYDRPTSLGDAVRILAAPGAMVLAGGTDFTTMYRGGAVTPDAMVDLKGLTELGRIEVSEKSLRIGATVTMRSTAALDSPLMGAVSDGAAVVGSPLTRNRATIGGNVCRASPAGDTLPGLLALGARTVVAGPETDRRIPIEDFFVAPGQTALRSDELLIAFEIDQRAGASAYQRLTYRHWMDLAVVGVAVWLELVDGECVDATVAFGGAAPTPRLAPAAAAALRGSRLDDDAIAAASAAVRLASDPIEDVRGSVDYRLRGLEVLTARVVRSAIERAGGQQDG